MKLSNEMTVGEHGGIVISVDDQQSSETTETTETVSQVTTASGINIGEEARKAMSRDTANNQGSEKVEGGSTWPLVNEETVGNSLYSMYGDDSIVSGENGNLFVRFRGNDYYTTAAGTKGDWLLRKYGNDVLVYSNDGVPHARDGDGDWYISSLPRRTIISGEEYYQNLVQKVQNEHPELNEEQQKVLVGEIIWNNNYLDLRDQIIHCRTPEEREELIKVYVEVLKKYEASGIPVAKDIEVIRERQGMGSVVLSDAELYEQDILIIKEENPGWNDAQAAEEYVRKLQAWNDRFHNVLSDIKGGSNLYDIQQRINYYENNGELQQFRDSGLDVDKEISNIKKEYNEEKVNIWSNWISDYSYSGVGGEYILSPTDAYDEVDDNTKREYNNDYETQRLENIKKVFVAYTQEFNDFCEKMNNMQFGNGRQLTDADREAGYQLMLTLNGLTYVRVRYEDGNCVIHPDDRQLYQESNQDVAKSMLLGGVLPGVIKGVNASGKSLLKAFTQESSKVELDYITTSGLKLEATPGKTTTVLGTYMDDTKNILGELGNGKSTDFGPRDGGFNLLNTPDKLYKTSQQFWNEYNKPWLDNVIARNDIIKLATEPTNDVLYRINIETGIKELSGFGKEYDYLLNHGYEFDSNTMQMIPKN